MDGLYRSRYFILFMFTAPSPLSSPLSAYYTPSVANLKNLSRYIQHMTI